MNLFKYISLAVLALVTVCIASFLDADLVACAAGPLISTDYMTTSFNKFEKWLVQNGMLPGGSSPIITMNRLRVIANLQNNKGTYEFDLIKGNGNNDGLSERRLQSSHIFMATHIGLGLQKYDTAASPDDVEANYPIFHHPDPNYFVGTTSGSADEWKALLTLFNGKLNLKTEGLDRLPDLPTEFMGYVPDSQYLLAAGSQVNPELPQSGPGLQDRGYLQLTPRIIIKGSETSTVTVEAGAGDKGIIQGGIANDGVTALTTRNRLVLDIVGFQFSQYTNESKMRNTCV